MLYDVFYWVHIISYIIWLLAFGGSLIFGLIVYSEVDAVQKRKLMRLERLINSMGAHIAALGILVSGVVMVSVPGGPQWGWLNVQLYPWLAIKQILFFVMLILIGFSIKRSSVFRIGLKREEGVLTTETSDKWARAYRMSMAVYVLVVVNTMLGLTKMNLGF